MKFRPFSLRADKLVAALACAGLALYGQGALGSEREDIEQLRSTALGLIQALVDQGLLSREKAAELLKKAESRNTTDAAGNPARVGADGKPVVRVPYVPESVKAEIRDQVKQEVLAQAKQERWGDPGALPDWLDRIHFEGDMRLRLEQDLFAKNNFPASNSPIGFVSQNQGFFSAAPSPFSGPVYGPDITNTTDDRLRLALRARFGFTAKVGDTVNAGFRLATGSLSSPASTSQTLGASNNNLNRYTIALDRGYLNWQAASWLRLDGGRMPNPYYSTDLVWAEDLGFDGVAATVKTRLNDNFLLYGVAGGFVLGENGATKFDKWLTGYQVGGEWALSQRTTLKFGLAQYDFIHYAGQPQAPGSSNSGNANYFNYNVSQYGPNVRQKGNSLFNIQDPNTVPGGIGTTTGPVWGLMANFRPLNLTASVDFAQFDPVHVVLTADYIKNIGFDRQEILARTGINLEPKTAGYQYKVAVGMPAMAARHDWQVFGIVRQLERDAVVDGFTDTTWNLGGTNYRGYSIGGSYGVDRNSWLTLRWTSTKNLPDNDAGFSGVPLNIDVLQLDLNARF
ncbi:MAG: hypothetical protein JWN73_1341 [Betaproteobacteria bacterium]|nr:hypothetical protein [Betaproteobacteria bacterium]